MTTEHKILALVDRGISTSPILSQLVGDSWQRSRGLLIHLGLLERAHPSGTVFRITALGLETLDLLDADLY